MATETSSRPTGAVAEAKEKGGELVSEAQEQISEKAHALTGKADQQFRTQFDQRSTQAGEQVHSIGKALQSGAKQLRDEGKDTPAKVVEEVARRADDFGTYLESTQADKFLHDIESFARRRPWLTAGATALAGFVASRFVKASGDRRYEESRSIGRAYGQSSPSSGSAGQPSLTAGSR